MKYLDSIGLDHLIKRIKGYVNAQVGEKIEITNDPKIKDTGAYALDATEKNPDIKGTLANEIQGHIKEIAYGETGVHGIRYYEGKLQIIGEDGEWIDVDTNGTGIAPGNVTGLKIKEGNSKLTIFWADPEDVVADGQTICTWAGTKLVMKVGSYPQNVNDGTLLVDSQGRDAYKENGFVASGLTNGTTYYFALFPYNTTNAVNTNAANRISGAPKPYRVMTVKVDLTNNNPNTCCSYADDAVDMVAGSEAWDEFFGHYPVLFKDGQEVKRLNRYNTDKFENGTDADITSGDAGDSMVAFPRHGLVISTSSDGNTLTVSMTDNPDDENFKYKAHERGTERREVFYYGSYDGYVQNGKLRSLKGKQPTRNNTIASFRNYAQENGDGYELIAFYQYVYLQCMYLLKYCSLNSQDSVATGYMETDNYTFVDTGETESWGMDMEIIKQSNPEYANDGKHHMKLFGIEDLWGNVVNIIDGVYTDANYNAFTATDNFADTEGYANKGKIAPENTNGYMSKPQGTTELGFTPKEANGSGTTYFCDGFNIGPECLFAVSGGDTKIYSSGIFAIGCRDYKTYKNNGSGSRLMYL